MTTRERVRQWREMGANYEACIGRRQTVGLGHGIGIRNTLSMNRDNSMLVDVNRFVSEDDKTWDLSNKQSALLCYLIAEVLNG